jgi:hypothetical protein
MLWSLKGDDFSNGHDFEVHSTLCEHFESYLWINFSLNVDHFMLMHTI